MLHQSPDRSHWLLHETESIVRIEGDEVLAKIALTNPSKRDVAERCERPRARVVAQGDGWTVLEIVCTLGHRTGRLKYSTLCVKPLYP
jgi:hypothetical protein